MYTEDGTWTSAIINNGFWNTLLHARGDYLVVGNIILLGIAYFCNRVFFGYNLTYLPHFVAAAQYVLFSWTALLPIMCFKKDIRKGLRYLMWLSILMVPLGESGVEIFGKVSNVGYLFYFIPFCLLYRRISNRENLTKIKIILIDIFLLISCGTNPGSYLLVGAGFFVDCFVQYKTRLQFEKSDFKQGLKSWIAVFSNKMWILLGALCVIMALYDILGLRAASPENYSIFNSGTNLTIEFFARQLLFYLIYPFYSRLNNWTIIVAGLFAFAAIVLAYVFFLPKISAADKWKLAICIAATLLLSIITTVARGGLLILQLNHYSTTWVDRYYYGLNIMTLVPIFFVVEYLLRQAALLPKIIACAGTLWLVACPIVALPNLLDFTNPNTANFTHEIPFTQRFQEATYDAVRGKWIVPIDFIGFNMELPEENYFATLQNKREMLACTTADLTDENWNAGVGQGGILLFVEDWYNILTQCDTLAAGEQTVKVLEVAKNGPWVHVLCDTTELSNFAYPNEITFTLKGDTKE